MLNDLNVNYNSGYMHIHLDTFFPTSNSRLRKLINIINMDAKSEEHIDTLHKFFLHQIFELKKEAIKLENEIQDKTDESRSYVNNSKELKRIEREQGSLLVKRKRCYMQIEKFEKHIELIKKYEK